MGRVHKHGLLELAARVGASKRAWLADVVAAGGVGVSVDEAWGRAQFRAWGEAHAPDLDAVGVRLHVQHIVAVNVIEQLVADARADLARQIRCIRKGRRALLVLWLVVRGVLR